MTIKQYIKTKKSKNYSISGIEVHKTKNLTNPDISDRLVIGKMISRLPKKFLQNIKTIHIGEFKFLKDRDMQAAYKDSQIYITNEQSDESDMLDDLIHEVAHSVEEVYGEILYSDLSIEREFLKKRQQLKKILDSKGIYPDSSESYSETEYSIEFDEFLYKTVGYPALSSFTASMFYSPYGATSLSEYFANGFEAVFYDEDLVRLKKISPLLYNKIEEVTNYVEN